MKQRNPNDQRYHKQGHSHNPQSNDQDEPVKGMHREAKDELLTTGGPVDRSAVEDQGDHGVVEAYTGGMQMADEEANTSKDSFPAGSRLSVHDLEDDDDEPDYSPDKTEGIINPRSTMSEWADWKTDLGKRKEEQGRRQH